MGTNSLDALCEVLASLNGACRLVRMAMESAQAPGHREGESWANWIRALTKIARRNKLPGGVSKDSDKSDRTSPFVLLVEALQECVPQDARRHTHSRTALADGITVARRGERVKSKFIKKDSGLRRNGGNKVRRRPRKSPA
jgi:hypothetical protein